MRNCCRLVSSLLAPLVCVAIPASAALTGDDLLTYWGDHSDLGVLAAGGSLQPTLRNAVVELLAKAVPDEYFNGIPPMGPPLPPNPALTPPPYGEGTPKVNQAYVWGLTEAEGHLWFGTAANVHALVLGGYLSITNPIQTESFVAEFGHSYVSQALGVPAMIGDWRPPRIFRYDPVTGQNMARDTTSDLPMAHLQRLRTTLGLRSAGSWLGSTNSPRSLVFLAGPALAANGGLNMFAYDARTETLVGSTNFPTYNNIRKWLFHGGALYTAVGKTAGGGAILRWQDDPSTPGWPWAFEEIGQLDGAGVELAVHDSRLFVSTWPGAGQALAALWMSPVVPAGGLHAADSGNWQRVWKATDYEPDPVTASTYGTGALASFEGALYWGTMHVPGVGLAAHSRVHGTPPDQASQIAAALGSHRAISIYRCADFGSGSSPTVELLYGEQQLPVYAPVAGGWVLAPNAMGGAAPRFGHSGLGNPFNNYTWTMDRFQDELYLGTMDFSYVVFDMVPLLLSTQEQLQLRLYLASKNIRPESFFGADLFCFANGDSAARAISRQGVGNPSTYGIRTMVSTPERLYLGMANPMNLLTDPSKPLGGWELLALTRRRHAENDFDGDGIADLTVYHPASGDWYVQQSGDGKLNQPSWGWSATIPVPGDYDGDGTADSAVYHPEKGDWYIKQSSNGGFRKQAWGWDAAVPVHADYDGDGKTDIAVYHPARGDWYILQSGNNKMRKLGWGWFATIPVPGDYDGDGKTDIAVYHPEKGDWYILQSRNGAMRKQAWGWYAANPVPSDYDGDGRTDIAVYHQAAGDWYILQSSNAQMSKQSWGWHEARPVASDYDGDGRVDVSVYNPSVGDWYILQSENGTMRKQNWGWHAARPVTRQDVINRWFRR
ncbi:MAG TPA: hypothetical protein DCS43_05665 [Verrucomicrobia bacterium]|nr:hypothetical protein [Verrucomicrobiota bacterium]